MFKEKNIVDNLFLFKMESSGESSEQVTYQGNLNDRGKTQICEDLEQEHARQRKHVG